jgi:hypothetical protein
MSRRSRSRDEVVTIWWRDIPAQVNGGSEKRRLDARFQHAIDRAAIVAGLAGAHEYTRQWRREATQPDGPVDAAAIDRATELDAAYPQDRLDALARRGGLDTDQHTDHHTDHHSEEST